MISLAYVSPFVKRQKNDGADAEPICKAVVRPTMHVVPVKNEMGLHRFHSGQVLMLSGPRFESHG